MDRLGGDFGAFDGEDGYGDSHADEGFADDGAHSNPPPSVVGQDERRMQVRAYNHWASLLGDHDLPHIEDLEPEFLGDFGPYSVLLDFSTGSETPTLQYIGTELRGECRLNEPIDTLGEIPDASLLSQVARNYLKVVAAQAPVTFEAESVNAKGRSVAYRGILLPYSSDRDTIDFVYAVVNWKEVADAATADALLSEIDAALEADFSAGEPVARETEPFHTAEIVHFAPAATPEPAEAEIELDHIESDGWESDDNILELRGAGATDDSAFEDLPTPTFGQAEEDNDTVTDSYDPDAYRPAYSTGEDDAPAAPKRNRAVDALGNPIGGAASEDEHEEASAGGITTAADYGLPDWDEEEEPEDDVDDLVNPLANIDLNSRLLSLVNSGSRGKKTVDLATLSDTPVEEDEAEEERQLFKPKAPSVETVLSLEEYDETEDEAEEDYSYDYASDGFTDDTGFDEIERDVELEAEGPVEIEADELLEASDEIAEIAAPIAIEEATEVSVNEAETEAAEPPAYEPQLVGPETAAQFDPQEVDAEEIGAAEEWAPEPEAIDTHAEIIEAADEPFELSEDLIVEDEVETEPHVEAEAETATFEDAEPHRAEEPVAEAEVEAEELNDEAAEPESLHGLLAAVNELAEAARTTTDPDRKALYEAVGKAFDISIKAVLASDTRGAVQPDIQPRDLADHFEDMKAAALRQHG